VLESPKPAGSIGFADHAAARVDRLFDPSASLPRLFTPVRVALTGLALAAAGALAYSSPRPSSAQSDHLHGMTVNLLQHHLQARAIGFVATAAVVAAVLAGMRRYAGGARSTHASG
jgi:hypothetical protein